MKKIFLSLVMVLVGLSLSANSLNGLSLMRTDDVEYLLTHIMNSFYYEDADGTVSFIRIPNACDFQEMDVVAEGDDIVYLKNGTVLKCTILEQTDQTLLVRTSAGNEITLSLSNVEKIVTQFVDGNYNFTITSEYPSITVNETQAPVAVTVNNVAPGVEITKASEFNGPVFPHLTKIKGALSPKEDGKPNMMKLDHYVGDGVDFDAVEFETFIKMYCPKAAKQFKKFRINIIAGSALAVVLTAGSLINLFGVIDLLVVGGIDLFLLGKAVYHLLRPLKVYNKEYADKPFAYDPDANANGCIIPVEQPVYSLLPVGVAE